MDKIASEIIYEAKQIANSDKDKTLIKSHINRGISTFRNKRILGNKNVIHEAAKIIGSLLIGICLNCIFNPDTGTTPESISITMVFVGIIGGLSLSYGLFANKNL